MNDESVCLVIPMDTRIIYLYVYYKKQKLKNIPNFIY